MKNKKTIIIIVVIIIALIIGGVFVFGNKYNPDKKLSKHTTLKQLYSLKVEHGELKGVSYFHGGGMLGETYRMEIKNEDGKIIGRIAESGAHYIPERVYEYKVSEDALIKAREYIDKYNLSVWDALPFNEDEIVLDGPSTSIYLVFDDSAVGGYKYSSSTISYENVVPKGGYDILNGFVELISNNFKKENFVRTYLDVDGKQIFTGKDIENSDEEIGQLLTGYWQAEKETTYVDGNAQEKPIDGDHYYYIDYSYSFSDNEEIELRTVGINEINKTYKLNKPVHEKYEDYDCSWFIEASNTELPVPETLYFVVVGEKLYVERTYTYADSYVRDVLVFLRKD